MGSVPTEAKIVSIQIHISFTYNLVWLLSFLAPSFFLLILGLFHLAHSESAPR